MTENNKKELLGIETGYNQHTSPFCRNPSLFEHSRKNEERSKKRLHNREHLQGIKQTQQIHRSKRP